MGDVRLVGNRTQSDRFDAFSRSNASRRVKERHARSIALARTPCELRCVDSRFRHVPSVDEASLHPR
jgi:hypothetical protein